MWHQIPVGQCSGMNWVITNGYVNKWVLDNLKMTYGPLHGLNVQIHSYFLCVSWESVYFYTRSLSCCFTIPSCFLFRRLTEVHSIRSHVRSVSLVIHVSGSFNSSTSLWRVVETYFSTGYVPFSLYPFSSTTPGLSVTQFMASGLHKTIV